MATPSTVFSGKFHIRVTDSEMSRESVCPTEGFLFGAKTTPDLLLACIVNRVFVSRKIIRTGKHCVAGLAGTGVDPVAAMRACLAVQQAGSHRPVRPPSPSKALGLSVAFPFVFLQ